VQETFDPHPETPPRGLQKTEPRRIYKTDSLPNPEVDRLRPISQLVEVELEISRDPSLGPVVPLEDHRPHRLLVLFTLQVEVDLEILKRRGKAWTTRRGRLWPSTRGKLWPSTMQRPVESRESYIRTSIMTANRQGYDWKRWNGQLRTAKWRRYIESELVREGSICQSTCSRQGSIYRSRVSPATTICKTRLTIRGGGNFHGAGERGRVASGGDKPGVFGSIVRSLSRAAGRDKSTDRPRD